MGTPTAPSHTVSKGKFKDLDAFLDESSEEESEEEEDEEEEVAVVEVM